MMTFCCTTFVRINLAKLRNTFHEVFIPDRNGYTPLHVACKENELAVIKFFLSELDLILNFNFLQYIPSLLMLACQLKRKNIVKFLSEYHDKPLLPCPNVQVSVVPVVFTFENKPSMLPNENALFFAVRRGDIKLFKLLSKSFTSLDITNNYGDTILHAACVSCDFDMFCSIFQDFIRTGVNTGAKNNVGNTCLHVACEWGSSKIVNFLIENKFLINEQNLQHESPLHLAVRNKRESIFNILLDNNADLDVSDIHGETPLHVATCDPNGISYVEKITSSNCNSINAKDSHGDTPLFNACRTKNKKMVFHLLKKPSCDALAINQIKNETIASIACRFYWKDVLKELLSRDSVYPTKLQNYLGQTLIHIASRNNNFKLMKFLTTFCESYDLSEDINLLDNVDELTPLQFACKNNDAKVFSYLLNLRGCFADTKNKNGDTVLHICSSLNMKEMAEICLPHCSRTVRNEQGNTPLHVACERKHFDLLYWLIKSLPADRRIDGIINKEGKNILHVVAAQEGTFHILQHMVLSIKYNHYHVGRNENTALHFAFQNGVLKNAEYLLKHAYKKELWFNKEGQSPLSLAIQSENYEFVKSIINKCDENMLLSCCKVTNPNHKYFSQTVQSVQMPLIFYLLYLISAKTADDEASFSAEQKKRYSCIVGLIYELLIHKNIHPGIVEVKDSNDNTILHYISMCNYNKKLDELFHAVFRDIDLNCSNKDGSTPLHYACSSPQDWMVINLFKDDKWNALKSLNKKGLAGKPFSISVHNQTSHSLGTSFYLVAQGATSENEYLRSVCNLNTDNAMSIGIIVLGNSAVGKTTLIDSLRMMITNDRKSVPICQPTTGIMKNKFVHYKNRHRYVFYDFAGQVEFETIHSVHLENLLSAAHTRKNHFAFLLVVKGTDTLEQNKMQIDRWISFVRGHVRINTTTVHVVLICSHDDHYKSNHEQEKRKKCLTEHFESCDACPLNKHEYPIFLNGTKADTSPVGQLMAYLEDMFISCEPFENCEVTDEVNYYIQKWFSDRPCQVKELIKKIRDSRTFELDHYHVIQVSGSEKNMIIPQELQSLVVYLTHLFCRNDILLLKPSDCESDWWIVGDKVQNELFSKANSLFSPKEFSDNAHHSLETFNTGVVPLSKLKEIFSHLKLDMELIINYLISLEFCDKISEETASIIGHERNNGSEKLFFFPGLIRMKKDLNVFKEVKKEDYTTSGWLIQNEKSWGLRFLHCLLLRLTYIFAVVKNKQYFTRRIQLWTNGLFMYTDEMIEVLVELKDDKKVYVICRSLQCSSICLAKLSHDILNVIRNIQHSMKHRGASEFSNTTEYVLYPPPCSYSTVEDSQPIPLTDIKRDFTKMVDTRAHFISDTNPVFLRDLFCFEPYVYIELEMIKSYKDDSKVTINQLFEQVCQIPELKERNDIPLSDLHQILQLYSVFSVDELADS